MVQSFTEDALDVVSFDRVHAIEAIQLLILVLVMLQRARVLSEEAPFRIVVATRDQAQFLSLLYSIGIFLGWTAGFGTLDPGQIVLLRLLLHIPAFGSATRESVPVDRWGRSVVFGLHHGPSFEVAMFICTCRVSIFLEV